MSPVDPVEPLPTPLATARARALDLADVVNLRLRKVVRAQLDAARRSDSVVRRAAYVRLRQTARRTVNAVTDRQLGWTATVWRARWLQGTTYEVRGWAYERGYGYQSTPQTRVYLVHSGTRQRVDASVRMVDEMEINGLARRADQDYANTGFVATFDLAPVLADTSGRPWQVRVEVIGPDGSSRRGTLKQRHRLASPGVLSARTFPGDVQLVPSWQRRRGLFFDRVQPRVMTTSVAIAGREVTAELRLDGVEPERVELVSSGALRPVEFVRTAAGIHVTAQVPPTWVLDVADDDGDDGDNRSDDTASAELRDVPAHNGDVGGDGSVTIGGEYGAGPGDLHEGQRLVPQIYTVVVTDPAGQEHVAACSLDLSGPVHGQDSGMYAYEGSGGQLCLSDAEAFLLVEEVQLSDDDGSPVLHVSGRAGGDLAGVSLVLQGRRQQLPAELAQDADSDRWEARFALLQSQWGGPALLPRTGSYTLRASREQGPRVRVTCDRPVIDRAPERLDLPAARVRLEIGRGRTLRLRVGLTRAADELGSYHQRRLEEEYLDGGPRVADRVAAPPSSPSVYLESFYGRLATCNPYALDRALARQHPGWTRYWGVTDLSVAVPEGAIPVVEGTRAWFEARATCDIVIGNDWFRRRFHPQPHQTVFQTWHGSMFKRIGLDRPAVRASTRAALETERDKWDILLSQNHHSTQIFGTSYDWTGPVYEEGYPRNDPLSGGSGAQIRERLGLRPDQKVVLYAPTWRDDVPGLVVFLDLERLARDLGDDYVILLRGHSRTVGHGSSVLQRGVIDVTTYPSITELFLAADALVTDYSSVMFDYSVTRRPMIFFVPDLDSYRDDVRGVYFDLAELAPGPLVTTHEEVVAAIRSMDDQSPYAQRYAEWVRRFNAHDDGHSSDRVIRRLLADHAQAHGHDNGQDDGGR